MPRHTLLASAIALLAAPPAGASLPPFGPKPPPRTWAVPSLNGMYLFVMRADTPDGPEDARVTAAEREAARAVWHRYPTSGLYRAATGELMWATTERVELATGYQWHRVLVLDDGAHVVWLAHQPHGPRKNPPRGSTWDPFGNQTYAYSSGAAGDYAAECGRCGLRIMARGVTVGEYRPDELVRDPDVFVNEFGYGFQPWIAAADFDSDAEQLVLTTLDDQRITFDLTTGDVLDRESTVRVSVWIWVGAGAVVVLAAFAVVLFRRPRVPAVVVETPVDVSETEDLVVTPPPPGLGRRRSGWHAPVRR